MEETRNNVAEMVETVTSKPYYLRALEAKDVFIVSKILSQIGLKEFKGAFDAELFAAAGAGGNKKNIEAIGMSVFFDMSQVLLGNLPKCENDIYAFLSSLSGKSKKEIEALPMNTFIEMVIDVIKKDEFMDFFKLVSKLFK